MSASNPKVTLLLELKNKIKTGLQQATSSLSSGVDRMKTKLGELKARHMEAFNSMAGQVPGLGNALSLLANPYALVTAAIVALAGGIVMATKAASDWEKSLAQVNVTAQLSQKELKDLGDDLMNIGMRNNTPLQEVPQAFNKIVSAGLDTKDALAALEPTLKATKASFTDVSTVAAAAVSTMNSSGISDATHVYDVLFATLNKGNAEFADIANYLPKIVPGARAAGQSLEDTAGAFAYLTAQGWKSEAAATGIMNVMKALSSESIIKNLSKMKISVFDKATGQARPLLNIVGDIKKKMDGLTDQQRVSGFGQIGFDMEAANAIQVMTQDYQKLGDTIEFTRNSQGQLNEAVKNSATSTDDWQRIMNVITGGMIKLGQLILPHVAEALEVGYNWVTGIYDMITNADSNTGGWIGTVRNLYTYFKGVLDLLTAIPKQIFNIVKQVITWAGKSELLADLFYAMSTGIGLIGEGISWLAGLMDKLYNASIKPFLDALEGIEKAYRFIKGSDPDVNLNPQKTQVGNDLLLKKLSEDTGINPNQLMLSGMVGRDAKEILFRKETLIEQAQKGREKNNKSKIAQPFVTPTDTNPDRIAGSAKGGSTITIGEVNMVKGDVISQNKAIANMSKEELLRFFEEMWQRLGRNAIVGA